MTSLDFQDPYEMLLFFDEELLNQQYKLHDWQKQFMLDFSLPDWNYERPFRAVIRAANGSGKDKFIIAACFVWFLMKYPQSLSVVTSSTGKQLDRQTDRHIRLLCQSVNTLIGEDVWKINYRHYEFLPTKSYGELFATDEAGNAEGWHPTTVTGRSEEHTSELQSLRHLVCRLLLE